MTMEYWHWDIYIPPGHTPHRPLELFFLFKIPWEMWSTDDLAKRLQVRGASDDDVHTYENDLREQYCWHMASSTVIYLCCKWPRQQGKRVTFPAIKITKNLSTFLVFTHFVPFGFFVQFWKDNISVRSTYVQMCFPPSCCFTPFYLLLPLCFADVFCAVLFLSTMLP